MDAGAGAERRVGQEIAGKYRLLRLLGSGGMGAVYEALHEFTQRRVALKLMHPTFARSSVAAERFVREAQAPSSIGHPGIVQILDGGRDADGSLYLVLELLEGETLAEAMREGPLPLPRLGAIALQLLDALQAAHVAGFVHRDIKPENVFLAHGDDDGDEPRVKLLDFGVVAVLAEPSKPTLTQAGAMLGTPLYMSPEQALGRRVDARSDLWSVGSVLYQALAGRAPFQGDSLAALVVSISSHEHLPLSAVRPDLPIRVTQVVERALQKDAAERWASAAEMRAAFEEALARAKRRDPEAKPASAPVAAGVAAPTTTAKPAEVHWAQAVIVAIAVAAVGGVIALQLSRTPSRETSDAEPAGQPAARAEPPPLGAVAPRQPTAPAAHAEPGAQPGRITTAGNASTQAPRPASAPPLGTTPTPASPAASSSTAPTSVATPPFPKATSMPGTTATATIPNATTATAPSPPPTSPSPAGKTLDDAQLSQVVESHQSELQRCYQDWVVTTLMREAPGSAKPAPSQLDVQLAIEPSGAVQQVKTAGNAPEPVASCARNAIRKWTFPASSAPSVVSFPVAFQPELVGR